MKVAIIGTGYVGLTTGVSLAFLGHDVTCLDVDESKISALNSGLIPIYEPHLDELMKLARHRLKFTTQASDALGAAQVVFIAVGTPSLPDGKSNLSYLKSAAQSVGQFMAAPHVVIVNKSTVPIGSGNWVESLVRDEYREKNIRKSSEFSVASNPEFLREGSALSDMLYADRVVVGADHAASIQVLRDLYQPLLEQTFDAPSFLPRPENFKAVHFLSTDLQSAELIKYAANAFLALKVSFINEVAELSEKVGADIVSIARGIGLDARIGNRFLQAGLGWGGSCFGKDTLALISTGQEYGLNMPITQAAREVNFRQRRRLVEILAGELKILKGKRIGLLGLAFKPNTDDLRDSPALEIARMLLDRGAQVVAFDPIAMKRAQKEWSDVDLRYADRAEDVFVEADAVVHVTEWPEFRTLPYEALKSVMRVPLVVDGRVGLDRDRLVSAGLKVIVLGKSS